MKRLIIMIFVLAVSTLFSAASILADDYNDYGLYVDDYSDQLAPPAQNECLLYATNCATNFSTVHERIEELKREITRGLDVYTPGELQQLEDQLKWLEMEAVDNIDQS
jgi:hypothetical protein